ncbi:SHOCT domain-containing protein [Ilumatobacter fluminis]|uniref:SHOCT domain-containing protein n=1 Tax=Ilumatobacter fluminis TaxID=467091 RepID=UPI0032EAC307
MPRLNVAPGESENCSQAEEWQENFCEIGNETRTERADEQQSEAEREVRSIALAAGAALLVLGVAWLVAAPSKPNASSANTPSTQGKAALERSAVVADTATRRIEHERQAEAARPSPDRGTESPTVRDRLEELSQLHEEGIITQSEYEQSRAEVLRSI